MTKKAFLITFVVFFFSFRATSAYAHDLIPRALQDFVATHPGATAQEIKAFADSQGPELAAKFASGEQIIAIIRNQETSLLDNAFDFLKLGVEHILSGADHILFVLSLLLVFVGLKDILRLTGIFTIAHSITLALSGLGLLVVSPRITEPLIAFSIAYVAITSVFFAKSKLVSGASNKAASVFFFGLFHGLGFAGLLREIQIPQDKFVSSLFSFNVGIEIGQLLIIVLALPFILWARSKSWYPRFLQVVAVLIALVALYWVVERVIA